MNFARRSCSPSRFSYCFVLPGYGRGPRVPGRADLGQVVHGERHLHVDRTLTQSLLSDKINCTVKFSKLFCHISPALHGNKAEGRRAPTEL